MPYPADYGGVIDVFYRLLALYESGIKIHLHCFDYGRGRQPELAKYCSSVNYYERYLGHTGIANTIPYIVASRKNEQLMQTLLQDDHPILMEGIHCTSPVLDKRFHNRKMFVRLHNAEHLYYGQLAKTGSSVFRKIYYWMESRLLKSYEKKICNRAVYLAISKTDEEVYRKLGCHRTAYIPAFIPFTQLNMHGGLGEYCLYHGDLSVEVNEKAVIWLLDKIFTQTSLPLVIAGRQPSEKLAARIAQLSNVCLINNPVDHELQALIEKAQVHVMPAYIATGIKLKLLNALFNGRHCVVNKMMVQGSELESFCYIEEAASDWINTINRLFRESLTEEEMERRKTLPVLFNNKSNAEKIIRLIWGS